ncbi:hypothetical protein IPL85_04260 [Candidatus Saccharibacteria bacterium]|nr:MAG: hypothetical protein IPL85_04260 [Candidatus Saccharibacteria bacterium]
MNTFGDYVSLILFPDIKKPLDILRKEIAYKDALLKKRGGAVVLDAYTKICVAAEAANLISRNPGYAIGIDPTLSIDNGHRFTEDQHAAVPLQYLET